MTAAASTVLSNAKRTYSCGIPAVILYPSLGAPTFVTEANSLHLFVLSKSDLVAAEVNARLKLYGEFGPIHWHKTWGSSDVMVPGNLCTDPGWISAAPKKPIWKP